MGDSAELSLARSRCTLESVTFARVACSLLGPRELSMGDGDTVMSVWLAWTSAMLATPQLHVLCSVWWVTAFSFLLGGLWREGTCVVSLLHALWQGGYYQLAAQELNRVPARLSPLLVPSYEPSPKQCSLWYPLAFPLHSSPLLLLWPPASQLPPSSATGSLPHWLLFRLSLQRITICLKSRPKLLPA